MEKIISVSFKLLWRSFLQLTANQNLMTMGSEERLSSPQKSLSTLEPQEKVLLLGTETLGFPWPAPAPSQ